MKYKDCITEREYQDRLESLLKTALNTNLRPQLNTESISDAYCRALGLDPQFQAAGDGFSSFVKWSFEISIVVDFRVTMGNGPRWAP